jgi:hypothetical protein
MKSIYIKMVPGLDKRFKEIGLVDPYPEFFFPKEVWEDFATGGTVLLIDRNDPNGCVHWAMFSSNQWHWFW